MGNISESEPHTKRIGIIILHLSGAILNLIGGIIYILSGTIIYTNRLESTGLIALAVMFPGVLIIFSTLIGLKSPLGGGFLSLLIGVFSILPFGPLGAGFVSIYYLDKVGLGFIQITGIILTFLGAGVLLIRYFGFK